MGRAFKIDSMLSPDYTPIHDDGRGGSHYEAGRPATVAVSPGTAENTARFTDGFDYPHRGPGAVPTALATHRKPIFRIPLRIAAVSR